MRNEITNLQNIEPFMGLPLEILPVIWMSYIDESPGPLAQIFTVEIGNAIFRDYIVNMSPRGYHARSFFEVGGDT